MKLIGKLSRFTASAHSKPFRLTLVYSVPFLTVFVVLLVAMLVWELRNHKNEQLREFREAAKALYGQIMVEKLWYSRHKNVYIMGDNEHMTSVPSEAKYSKVDYATMASEMSEIANQHDKYNFHVIDLSNIASLGINDWEVPAIQRIKEGSTEEYSFMKIGGKRYFRYIGPLYNHNTFLAEGGNRGDFQKVVSLTIPTGVLDAVHRSKVKRTLISLTIIGLTSMIFIIFMILRFSKKISARIDEEMTENRLKAAMNLAGAAAHEMRQPLTIIIGNVELLKDRISKGDNADELLKRIDNECYRIDDIIIKMLNITHYKTIPYNDHVEIFDLHAQEVT
jgi:hypothetical protein